MTSPAGSTRSADAQTLAKASRRHAAPVRPGERIWFRPDNPAPGDTTPLAALVLGPRTAQGDDDPVRAVVTESHVVSRDAALRPNAVVRLLRAQVVVHEINAEPPLLRIATVGGRVVGLRRTDGRTAPVGVEIHDLDPAADLLDRCRAGATRVVLVDHAGERAA